MFAVSSGREILYANKLLEQLVSRRVEPGELLSDLFVSPSEGPDQGDAPVSGAPADHATFANAANRQAVQIRFSSLFLEEDPGARLGVVVGVSGLPGGVETGQAPGLAAPQLVSNDQDGGAAEIARLKDMLRVAEAGRREAVEAALHDPATGLRNRTGLDLEIEDEISKLTDDEHLLILLYLDLNHFKHINDAFGHPTGDKVLCAVARCFRKIKSVKSAARVGGDEFAFLVRTGGVSQKALHAEITRLMPRVFAPVRIDGRLVTLGGSVGVSIYGRDADVDELSGSLLVAPHARDVASAGHAADAVNQPWNVFRRTDIHQSHAQKFVFRIAVMTDRGFVHFKKAKPLNVVNPHRLGMAMKEGVCEVHRILLFHDAQVAACDALDRLSTYEFGPRRRVEQLYPAGSTHLTAFYGLCAASAAAVPATKTERSWKKRVSS